VTAPHTAHVGVGLKLDCPNGKYVSFITGMGVPNLTYQVVINAQTHPPFPWPPDPDSAVYGERCPCDVCCGRLVGDTVDAIQAEALAVQSTMTVNDDTYMLRYLESARDVIVREAQLKGCGIIKGRGARGNPASPLTETYATSTRRVEVRYGERFQEVEEVTVWLPVSTEPQPTYPDTFAGALAAMRASD
jgi:hypothetical protein